MLDTTVVSELMRSSPAPEVVDWVDQQPAGQVWLTSMTAAELLAGVALLPDGARKRQLAARVQTLLGEVFANRILPFDAGSAVAYAGVVAARRAAGTPIGFADATIAATCLAAGCDVFATRNTTDFTGTGLKLTEPWTAQML